MLFLSSLSNHCHPCCQFIAMQCLLKKVFELTLSLLLLLVLEILATISVLDKGLMPLEKNSIGTQFFVDVENKDRLSACKISTWAKDCCLTDKEEDCTTMQVYGGAYKLKPKDTDTVVFVYPTLFQHDQIGYCDFIMDYRCGRRKHSKRLNVNIPFDTRVVTDKKTDKTLLSHYIEERSVKSCESIDLNSLNNCEPVICDLKYGGERPFFDSAIGKCVEAALCEQDDVKELPDFVYVPNINSCRDLDHPLTIGDIYLITTGNGVITDPPPTEDVKVELKTNCSTISQNLNLLRDIIYGNLCPVLRTDTTDYKKCCKSALLSILGCIVAVCALLLSFICCVQTLVWLHKKLKANNISGLWDDFKCKFRNKDSTVMYTDKKKVNSEIRNTLLREVIVKDIPVELRDSVVDICQKIDRRIRRKTRYRKQDIGSQISLNKITYDSRTSSASTSSYEDNE